MKRLVLHVGPPKTASSYLQYRLFSARADLAAQSFEYPQFGLFGKMHSRIVEHLLGNAEAAGGMTDGELSDRLATFSNVVLSCEAFSYLNPEQLRRLRSVLKGFSIEVVFYYRSLVHLLPSHWQEYVKQGVDATFTEYLSDFAEWTNTLGLRPDDLEGQLAKLANVFGNDSLRIICFDNVIEQRLDIFEHFWASVLGLAPPVPRAVANPSALNASAAPESIDLLRNINELYLERTGHRPHPAAKLSESYRSCRTAIEMAPDFSAYRAAFGRYARQVTLTNTQDLLLARERSFLGTFGDRIENKVGPNRIFIKERMDSKVFTAPRFWPDRGGVRAVINRVYDELLPSSNTDRAVKPS
jgi:hypothetical protein